MISAVWMFFGVCFYSFIIGNLSSMLSSNMVNVASIKIKIKRLLTLAYKAKISDELILKLKMFLERNQECLFDKDDEDRLI